MSILPMKPMVGCKPPGLAALGRQQPWRLRAITRRQEHDVAAVWGHARIRRELVDQLHRLRPRTFGLPQPRDISAKYEGAVVLRHDPFVRVHDELFGCSVTVDGDERRRAVDDSLDDHSLTGP